MKESSYRKLIALVFLLGLSRILSSPAAGITGSEVIGKVQKRLAECQTLVASFEKEFYWAALDRKSRRKGQIWLRQPDRFRVEVEDGSLIVADGQAIWIYDRRNAQVVVSSYPDRWQTPWEILFNYAQGWVPLAVEEVELEGRPCYLLALDPSSAETDLVRVRLWVDRREWLLLKVEQQESTDNLITYVLKDHRTNKKLDDALFRFVPSQGVEVIDRRASVAGNE